MTELSIYIKNLPASIWSVLTIPPFLFYCLHTYNMFDWEKQVLRGKHNSIYLINE